MKYCCDKLENSEAIDYVWSDTDSQWTVSNSDLLGGFEVEEIDYCPFCGKRLIDNV